jgi:hypothetical protein
MSYILGVPTARTCAGEVISRYLTGTQPPSDYRVLFAAVLMQAKKDYQYTGGNSRTTPYTLEVRRWIDHKGDPAGITFSMCCEALSIDEGAARKYMLAPYKEARPWNGRNANGVGVTRRSAATYSKPRKRSSPQTRMSGSASYAASLALSSSPRTMTCSKT